MKREAPTSDNKPFVDASSFQQFLSAAYVVQQHNDHLQDKAGAASSRMLTAIVEIEEQIRSQQLSLRAAAQVMAQRAQDISDADGAAVGIIEKDQLVYYAAAGSAAQETGTQVALAASLSAESLQSGKLLQSSDAEKDPRLPSGFCREHGIKALIAAPATHQGKVVGVVELRFAHNQRFEEESLRACQLLADVLAETKARNNGLPQAPAPQRETMQDALARIKPQLARLAGEEPPAQKDSTPATAAEQGAPEVAAEVCRGCGHPLAKDEQFCGLCGTQRTGRRPLQSTWASLWDLQKKAEKSGSPMGSGAKDAESLDLLPSELERLVEELASAGPYKPKAPPTPKAETTLPSLAPLSTLSRFSQVKQEEQEEETVAPPDEAASPETETKTEEEDPTTKTSPDFAYWKPQATPAEAEVRFPFASGRMHDGIPEALESAAPESDVPRTGTVVPPGSAGSAVSEPVGQWTSATKARAWLDSLQARQSGVAWLVKQWQAQRANIYLGASVLVLLAVLFGWGSPDTPPPARTQPSVPQAPQLSLFDRMLVNLGLAEAPPAPVYQGNPNAKVWVDTHTALYYCAGAEQYGKTAGGKFVTQREAQLDAFEPAARKTCD